MNDDIDNIDGNDYDNDLAKGDEAEHNSTVRRRIDELIEKKRLKDLIDDSDDWKL